jgi:uncharacterized membrane protein YqiK
MIDAKNTAIQSALKAENEVKEAEANAKIAVAKAEGNAKAMKIKADAEAYYNRGLTRIFDNDKEGGLSDLSKAGELGLYNAYAVMKHFQENK